MEQEIALNIGTFFTVIFGLINLIIVSMLVWLMKDLRELSKEHRSLKDTVQTMYVTKPEQNRLENVISADIHEMKQMLSKSMDTFTEATQRIHDRIDKMNGSGV